MTARLTTSLWTAAHQRRCEIAGASALVARRGAAEAGAVLVKVSWLDTPPTAPLATALSRATLGDGRQGWIWLVGPDPSPEADVDAMLDRQAKFDPDVWIVVVEDREGRHFLEEPIA